LSLPIEYIDSSILVSYQLGPTDRFYQTAKEIMEKDILGKQIIGLISMLTLLEVIDVIRHRITERTNKVTLDLMDEPSKNLYVRTETEKKIKEMIDILTLMESQGFIVFADFTPLDLKQIMSDVYDYSRNYFGMVRKYFNCQICHNPLEHYSYKGLGWIDLLHAFLAVGLFADGLITADKGFGHLSTDQKFSGLKITVI